MKVLWCDFDSSEIEVIPYLEKQGILVIPIESSLDKIDPLNILFYDQIEIIVFSNVNTRVTGEILKFFSKLKAILTRTTGCNHIDFSYCYTKKIKVCNIKDFANVATAEYTILLILALLKQIKETILETNKEIFKRKIGQNLKDKTIGVVGTGRIGSEVARILKAFGCKILCFSFRENQELKKLGCQYVSLETLYKSSDVITFHFGLSGKTYHILNKESLKLLKRGCYIVNTARGGLIDLEALYEGIKRGIIAGAALDCFEGEDYFLTGRQSNEKVIKIIKELLSYPNIIFTPHNAFNTYESKKLDLEYTIKNLLNLKEKNECFRECDEF